MEEHTYAEPEPTPQPGLYLEDQAVDSLVSASKWAKFLAIVGFIFLGLMVLMGFSMGAFMALFTTEEMSIPFSPALFGFIYLFFAIIYFFPLLYLYQFASRAQKSARDMDSMELSGSLMKLNAHFRYVSILVIILLCLYVLIFIIALLMGGLAGLAG